MNLYTQVLAGGFLAVVATCHSVDKDKQVHEPRHSRHSTRSSLSQPEVRRTAEAHLSRNIEKLPAPIASPTPTLELQGKIRYENEIDLTRP